ncbi:MAG: hypothetical protein ABDI19_00285 [Armatimonadota bacterium]
MSRWRPLRERWQYWREEFYLDNPIAWLLSKIYRFEAKKPARQGERSVPSGELASSAAQTEAERVERPPLSQMPPVWVISRGERWFLMVMWSVALATLALALHQGWSIQVQALSNPMSILIIPIASLVAILITLILLPLGISMPPLSELVLPQGTLYAGMTRLQSTHIVHAVLTHALLRSLRRLTLYGVPWLLLLGTAMQGSLWVGLWFTAIVGLYLLLLVWFLCATSLALACGLLRRGHLSETSMQMLVFIIPVATGTPIIFGMVSLLPHVSRLKALPPVWMWHTEPLCWLSLVPPLFLWITPLVKFHPLWGIPQILLLLGLSWLMTRWSIAQLGAFRRLRERVVRVEGEEDWE